jgi:hypothetical protein
MVNQEKQAFWNMINVLSELYRRPALSKEAVAVWWAKLERFEFAAVSKAFDKWTESSSYMPTPHDIIQLCKPSSHPAFTNKLVYKVSDEIRAENKQKLNKMMKDLGWRKSSGAV